MEEEGVLDCKAETIADDSVGICCVVDDYQENRCSFQAGSVRMSQGSVFRGIAVSRVTTTAIFSGIVTKHVAVKFPC